MTRPEPAPIPGMEDPAGAHEIIPIKPPKGYRDPSEFEGVDERSTLQDIQRGAIDRKATDAWKKELGQKAQEREVDALFNALAKLQKPDKVEHTLWSLYIEAQQKKRGHLFLGDVQETLNRLKEFTDTSMVGPTQGILRFLNKNPEDVSASAAPPRETREAPVNATAETEPEISTK